MLQIVGPCYPISSARHAVLESHAVDDDYAILFAECYQSVSCGHTEIW